MPDKPYRSNDRPKTNINRRTFMGALAGTVGVACVDGLFPWNAFAKAQSPDLVVVTGKPQSAVKTALDALGGMESFVKQGDKVVIKPNMSFSNPPEYGSTTHPDVIATTAELCLDAGAKEVLVVDHTLRNWELCFEKTKIKETLSGMSGVSLISLASQGMYRDVDVPHGKSLKRTQAARHLLDADCFINMPTAKSHGSTGVSFGMKNLMGLVWSRGPFHFQLDLDQAVADLAGLMKPTLTIMDAQYALINNGPGGPGDVERLSKVIAGIDPVAVDAYTVTLAKWWKQSIKPRQVNHIKAAYEMGLGEIDLEKLTIREIRA